MTLSEMKARARELANQAATVVNDPKLSNTEKRTQLQAIEAETKPLLDEIDAEEYLNAQRGRFSASTQPGEAGGFAGAVLAAGWNPRDKPSVTLSAAAALGIKAAITAPDADTWRRTSPVVVPLAADRRFIFPNMPSTDAGSNTAVTDFTVTARAVTGTVQRAVDAVTDKASLGVTITHALEEIPQHAVVVEDIPNQLLESAPAISAVLQQEARLAVFQSIDDHTWSQITAAAPFGNTGTGLVAQIRNAIAAMRDGGYAPNLLIVDPADAVALDLTEDNAGAFLFPVASANASSPLFGLNIVESVAAVGADPLLVDTSRIGQLYLGTMRVEADPYSGFKQNLTDLRVETNALMHVRDADAAYRIGAA